MLCMFAVRREVAWSRLRWSEGADGGGVGGRRAALRKRSATSLGVGAK